MIGYEISIRKEKMAADQRFHYRREAFSLPIRLIGREKEEFSQPARKQKSEQLRNCQTEKWYTHLFFALKFSLEFLRCNLN